MAATKPITNRHKGATFVIGGTSPEREKTPTWAHSLDGAIVIGVNRYIEWVKCDYWLTCDTHKIIDRMPDVVPLLSGCETFMNERHALPAGVPKPDYWFQRPKGPTDNNIQPVKPYEVPVTWHGELQHVWTSATAAVNLAAIMGASRIILHGVDLVGDTTTAFNAPADYKPKPWADFEPDVSEFLNIIARICPVYKTNPRSPLKVPILI